MLRIENQSTAKADRTVNTAIRVSIVMPAMNEEGLLAQTVAAVLTGSAQSDGELELIIVENGSSDGTYQLAADLAVKHPGVRVLRLPRPDYGAALHAGLETCRGSIGVIFDVDYYDPAFLDYAQRAISEGADMVLARKLGADAVDNRAYHRRLATRVFSWLLRLFYGLQVMDTHGMKAINMDTMGAIARATQSRREMYDTELIVRAQRAGARIVETPVTVEELRSPRVSMWRRIPRTIRDLIALRIRLWQI
jgi:glycosyltransferase involved in cell wall biosynthesis